LRAHMAPLALIVIVVATAEEIVWRGWVPSLLAPRVGTRLAWVYAAVLYALSLVPAMWSLRDPVAGLNPVLPLGGLACGLAWGAMARLTGRLVPGLLSHVVFDWCAVMMFRLWGPSV